jgi:hypothetical protein
MPICCLKEVGSKDIGLGTSGIVGKANDFSWISKFNEAFQGSYFIAYFDVKVGGNFETALLSAFLSDSLG